MVSPIDTPHDEDAIACTFCSMRSRLVRADYISRDLYREACWRASGITLIPNRKRASNRALAWNGRPKPSRGQLRVIRNV